MRVFLLVLFRSFFNILGPTYVKNKMQINIVIRYLFGILLVITILSSLFYLNKTYFNEYQTLVESDYFGLTISLFVGSFVMVNALYKRQKMIFEKNALNNIFYTDIISGFSIILILPLLNFIGGTILFHFLI